MIDTRTRAGLLALAAEEAIRPKADVILHALAVMCAAAVVGATSEELGTAIFRARSRAWLSRRRDRPLIQGAAVQVPASGS